MTIFKWLAGVLIGLLLVLVLAIFLIPMFVDPNDYRQQITEIVEAQTGRELGLEGDLKISVFPWLGVRTQQLSLSQPAQIGGNMVEVETAQLRLKLLPLLSKRLEIDTVVLEQPTLRLITLADGTSSFTGLTGEQASSADPASTASPAASAPASTAGAESDAGGAAVALVVSGVEISNANLLWDDRQAGQKYEVKDFDLSTGNLLGSALADINLAGSVIDAANPTPIALALTGKARINSETYLVTMQNIKGEVSQGEQTLQLNFADMSFDQQQGISLQGLAVQAEMDIPAADAPAKSASVDLNLADLQYALAGANAGQVGLDKLNLEASFAGRDFNLAIPAASANLESQTAKLDELSLTSGDLNATLSGLNIKQFIDSPAASGQLDVKPFNVAAMLKDLGIDYVPSNKDALTALGLSTAFNGGMERAALSNIKLQLDQSNLQGNVAIADFEKLAATFDLTLDALNLDDYLPAVAADESAAQDSAQVEGAEALAIPLAVLKDINANGTFKAGKLISGGLEFTDIDVKVESVDGLLTVTPNAKLYDGTLGGQIAFSDSPEVTTLKVNNEIDLVDLAKLLSAADVSDQLSGIGSVDMDVTVTEKNGVQSNSGTIKLLAKNGAIKGIDIKKILDSAYQTYAKFTGGQSTEEESTGTSESSDETRFAEVLGTFYLQDYVLTNNDFSLKAPLFRIAGNGTIDIEKQSIDYLVKVAVVGSTDGQGGKAIEELAGVTIPIRLRGDLTAPGYSLDMKSLYQSYAKRELDKKKGQYLQDKLGIEGGEKMSTKDALKGALFKKLDKGDNADEQAEPVPYEQTEAEQQTNPDAATPEAEPELTEKQKRREERKKLLKGLFD